MKRRPTFTTDDEERGAREPFEDSALYDFEYRSRRGDVNFYRRLAQERMAFPTPGPILDLACGTGRITIPLLRDGHRVVGLDRSPPMLRRAAARIDRLSPARRRHALLVKSDLRRFAFRGGFALAICAFHSVQHLVARADLLRFFRRTHAALAPGGWLAFDILPPDVKWLARDPTRRWARTVFRHPTTSQRVVYTTNHVYDARRKALHMRLYYLPIDAAGQPTGPETIMRLCHRQLAPQEVEGLLKIAGFRLCATFGGFDGRLLDGAAHEHIYVARRE